ncbi:hypothetical protein [Photobacterium atrarenae]|uniref:Capsid protein n=1 Tax=Photobacterium atrarenae TaxID=865757 RepID=A0ABY5GND8_9GAMM|nr:hypothetical protein [Photobacterium atrarenae]UTV30847.1 hypothetical protein NNL38_20030 [Photobacterium atrarenae]
MANNLRTQTKAAIHRAMKAAMKATAELNDSALAEIEQLYTSTLAEIQLLVSNYADELGVVRLSQLHRLRQEIGDRLNRLAQTQTMMVHENISIAAQNGAMASNGTVAEDVIRDIVDDSVMTARTFKYNDGLQLSDRLWRIDRHAREVVINAVDRAVILGSSASEAADDFIRRGQPIPDDIVGKMKLGNADGINRVIATDLMTGKGVPYDHIRLVMQTEINRAHDMAFMGAAFKDPSVVGIQFTLHPTKHKKPDICDMHASANLYGLGRGVYPEGKVPVKHIRTTSYYKKVFEDEVTEDDRTGQTDRISWLKGQSREAQKAVLGHDKKVAALEKGYLTEGMIATPWKHLEPALKRKGINTQNL